jgi:hypothetical protein
MSGIGMPLFVYIIVAVILLSVFNAFGRRLLRGKGSSWTLIPATVFDTLIDQESKMTWTCKIVYSYSVDGEYYSGEDVRTFATEDAAEKFESMYPRGRKVLIRCLQGAPALTVLRDEDNPIAALARG